MGDRGRRIIESAIELADEGGFEAVRLRDVAERSGVALGTVYNRFSSKEHILVAGLEAELEKLEALLLDFQLPGEAPIDRVIGFFQLATRALSMRPKFARAVLRAVSSGQPALAGNVMRFHSRVTALIVAAYRGEQGAADQPDPEERKLGFLLQQVWFAALVGWTGEMFTEDDVLAHMQGAAGWLIRGYEAERGED